MLAGATRREFSSSEEAAARLMTAHALAGSQPKEMVVLAPLWATHQQKSRAPFQQHPQQQASRPTSEWGRLNGLVSVASVLPPHNDVGAKPNTEERSSADEAESPMADDDKKEQQTQLSQGSKRKSKYMTPEDRTDARRKRNREAQKLRRARNKEEERVRLLTTFLIFSKFFIKLNYAVS